MFDKNLLKLEGMSSLFGCLVVLAVVQAALIIAQTFSLSYSIVTFWEGGSLDDALLPVLLFLVSFIMLHVVRFVQDTILDRSSRAQAHVLNVMLAERTFDERYLISRENGSAHVASAMTEGSEEIQAYLRIMPPKIVGIAATSVPLLVCVFILDWPSGIILLVMFPVIVFFMILLGKQARERSEKQYGSYTRLTNRFMDTLRGMRTIKAFGATEREASAVHAQSEKLRSATMRTLATATLSSAVLDFCATFGVAAVAMMLAFRLMDGSVGLMTALLALMLSPEYFNPIRSFASDFHASLDGKNALADALHLIGSETKAPLSEAKPPASQDGEPVWSLAFENVGFSYPGSDNGVEGLTFYAKRPMKVGVIGKSGSGKTTFADLVSGFRSPASGTVLVNGSPADLTLSSWKNRVRYIPQSPYIFRDTLARNIAFYRPKASDEEIGAVARAVGLDALVDALPLGLQTLVGDGARGLSGGEAHRVALARVLLDDDADVLVFDEPTAHLDIETELELRAPMLEAMQGKLVFFATHRLHWIEDMDIVLKLDEGHVASKELNSGE